MSSYSLDTHTVTKLLKKHPGNQRVVAPLLSWGLEIALLAPFVSLIAAPLSAQTKARTGPRPADDVSTLLQAAEQALDRKDYAAAIAPLKKAAQVEPANAAVWFNLGFAFSELAAYPDAVAAYQKALEIQPDLFEAHLNLSAAYLKLGRYPEAQGELEKAIKLKPDHARAHLELGRALALEKNFEGAEKEFGEASRLDPKLAAAHLELAEVLLDEKKFGGAKSAFEAALELDPKSSQSQLGLALALEGAGKYEEAIPHYAAYLAANSGDLGRRVHLAVIEMNLGKNQEARDELQFVYEKDPKMPGVAAMLGDVNAWLKRLPEAERFYREALAATPDASDATPRRAGLHRALAQTLLDEEKFSDAETEFRAALKLDPENLEAFKGLASALYLEKRYADAVSMFEAESRDPSAPPLTFFVLASCYDHLHVIPKALAAYEKFLALSNGQNPDHEWQAQQRAKLLKRELRK
ncbi:MAG: hypothetical protein DMG21_21210 [Acidobacteria bacterium]|nr:MAG: hypothetical protein DMG21_21210 [Acidobacteriota bacterium]